jgi:hypothetical protein
MRIAVCKGGSPYAYGDFYKIRDNHMHMAIPICIRGQDAFSIPVCIWGLLYAYGDFVNEVEGIDSASVIIHHLSIGITAETVIKPIITNSLNSVHTKK